MPRNGSGTMTPDVDFTTEAASPPLETAKLDQVLEDIADEITNSIAADGQTNPSANLKMNGFRLTNLGAATALTDAARVSELIDQDHVYYVDSGAADAYVITPSPAIAAYEEGQRFVFRAANANTGASTLNVNGLGAIAIQTNNAAALGAGVIAAGGIYEVTYDANTTPDRWVLGNPSKIPDGMLSSNVALAGTANVFSATQTVDSATASRIALTISSVLRAFAEYVEADSALYLDADGKIVLRPNNTSALEINTSGNFDFKSGAVTTSNASASEVGFKGTPQNNQDGDYTLVLTDAGKTIYKAAGGAGETITIPANGSVAFPVGTIVRVVNNGGGTLTIAITTDTLSLAGVGTTGSRTLADHGVAVLEKVASTEWFISGVGVS